VDVTSKSCEERANVWPFFCNTPLPNIYDKKASATFNNSRQLFYYRASVYSLQFEIIPVRKISTKITLDLFGQISTVTRINKFGHEYPG
jgi:hypothetical protein